VQAIAPTVAPLIRRHAEDAAFYWSQLDRSGEAYTLGGRRALHFCQLLQAHLEGLAIAGPEGEASALGQLVRWKKPGEAFCAFWTALISGREPAQEAVWRLVRRSPDALLRGAISALVWAPEPASLAWVAAHARPECGAPEAVATLRACALRGWPLPWPWQFVFEHPHPAVRATACRWAMTTPEQTRLQLVQALLVDSDLAVRAEAAMALLTLLRAVSSLDSEQLSLQAASVLWAAIAAQAERAEAVTGWHRLQAQRRLLRWLRHLAHAVPLGHPAVDRLLQLLPPRLALSFVLNHGDADHCQFLLAAAKEPDTARQAGWVWQSLTGVDLVQEGLTRTDMQPSADGQAMPLQQSGDDGLPWPDARALARHPASHRPGPADGAATQRMLLGREVTVDWLCRVFDPASDMPQALRCLAAQTLEFMQPGLGVSVRCSAPEQARHLARLRAAT